MYEIYYDLDYSKLKDLINIIQEKAGESTNLIESIEAAGDYTVQELLNYSSSKFRHSQGGYARGIVAGIKYPFNGDPLHYRVEQTVPYAKAIEEGIKSFDMKQALFTSDKVRVSKNGKRYLVIPFRHGAPGTKSFAAMPNSVYDDANITRRTIVDGKVKYNTVEGLTGAKNMRQSVTLSTYQEGSIKGFKTINDANLLRRHNEKLVVRNRYDWQDRLEGIDYPKLKKQHKTNIYEGMVRFQANPNLNRLNFRSDKFNLVNQTDNETNYSSYMTFRIMSEKSQGWIHPGTNGMFIFRDTEKKVEEPIFKMIGDAAQRDFESITSKIFEKN